MKRQPIILLLIGIFFVITTLLLVRNNFTGKAKPEMKSDEQIASVANEFNINTIKVGDKIAEMSAVSISPYAKEVTSLPLDRNATISFTGEASIVGTYYYECSGFEGGCADKDARVCFKDLDKASQLKIPVRKNGKNIIWFCFSNPDEAKKLLPAREGKRKIVIDNYALNVYPSEVIDTADLIRVE